MSLRGNLNVLGYKTFSPTMEIEVKNIDKDGNESAVTISYKKTLLIVQDLWQVHYQIFSIK